MDQVPTQSSRSDGFGGIEADAFLFDIDGTLTITRDLVHYNALNRAMREAYEVETTIDGIAYHGKTDVGILRATLARAGISGARFERDLLSALKVVRREVDAHANEIMVDVCSGIPEILKVLYTAGKLIGVASGNLEAVGWHKIEAAGLRRFFTLGCFSDENEMRVDIFRQAVAEAQRRLGHSDKVCFVGDTPSDIQAAREIGAKIISVCTGAYRQSDLACLEPDLCVSSCTELLQRGSLGRPQ
jgi:phosphoglycolate phosphatase